ncbi:MAG: AAA family ATPase [Desulfomonilia bacterium]
MCECCNSHKRPVNEIIAVTGKGGTGKTTLVAVMAKILASQGFKVLAVDADPPISLTYALGATPLKTIAQIRAKMIEDPNEKRRIKDLPIEDVIADEAVIDLDQLSLLIMGKSEGPGCFCSINDLLKYGISKLSKNFDFTLIDCEAGIEQINRQVIDSINRMIMISDTSAKGLRTALYLNNLGNSYGVQGEYKKGLVINRAGKKEIPILEEKVREMNMDIIGFIPEDHKITEYDLFDRSIFELPKSAPSFVAIQGILERQGILT